MKIGALAGLGAMVVPSAFSSHVTQDMKDGVAYHSIAPFILLNKIAKLGIGTDFLGSDVRYAISHKKDYLVPGNALYSGLDAPFSEKELAEAVVQLKKSATPGSLDYRHSQRLSILIGALMGKRILSALGITDSTSIEDKVTADVRIIHAFFTRGHGFPEERKGDLSSLMKQMTPRTFVRFHTVMPDEKMGTDWVPLMQEWRDRLDAYYENLDAQCSGTKSEAILDESHRDGFIHKGEQIVMSVATFSDIDGFDREKAWRNIGSATSKVGKALAGGYQALIDINDYWSGKSSEAEFVSG